MNKNIIIIVLVLILTLLWAGYLFFTQREMFDDRTCEERLSAEDTDQNLPETCKKCSSILSKESCLACPNCTIKQGTDQCIKCDCECLNYQECLRCDSCRYDDIEKKCVSCGECEKITDMSRCIQCQNCAVVKDGNGNEICVSCGMCDKINDFTNEDEKKKRCDRCKNCFWVDKDKKCIFMNMGSEREKNLCYKGDCDKLRGVNCIRCSNCTYDTNMKKSKRCYRSMDFINALDRGSALKLELQNMTVKHQLDNCDVENNLSYCKDLYTRYANNELFKKEVGILRDNIDAVDNKNKIVEEFNVYRIKNKII